MDETNTEQKRWELEGNQMKTETNRLAKFEKELENYRHAIWDRADKRNIDVRLPVSQFRMPRIHINTSDDGETTLMLDYGLPCCGVTIILECPETLDLAFLRAFTEKTNELREWLKDNYFNSCAIPAGRDKHPNDRFGHLPDEAHELGPE